MAHFEKVSFGRYNLDTVHNRIEYDNIKLPVQATSGSAGHDFFLPHDITIPFGGYVTVPTGIRVILENDEVLYIIPRSGLGFKYGLSLANTIGVIDSDYSKSDNEGHIFVKIVNASPLSEGKDITLKKGDAFCQGIIQKYMVADGAESNNIRNGGFGSTEV